MASCPVCQESFKDRHALKTHHGLAHGEPLPEKGEHPCDSCHRAFSTKAGMRHHHTTVHGESLVREDTTCETCDESFTYHVERDEGRFCSLECHHEWLHEYMSGEDSPLYEKVTRECDECGEEFDREPFRANLNDSDYCSYDCYHENHSGKDNPNWKGGDVFYGPTWQDARKQALERDDHECQDCGRSRSAQREQYGKDLEVHHKTPFRTFNDATEAHQLSNLITVCTECHIEREHS